MAVEKADFDYVRDLVRERAAIVIEPGKAYLVESRLEPLARSLEGIGTIAALVAKLRRTPRGSLHEQVVEAMTTNETSFFRDVHPFEALKQHVLPTLVRARAAQKRLNIWCSACSSGQEPYTIAMLLRENFPELRDWQVSILATDYSPEMLARAQKGYFSQLEVNRGLPSPLFLKYFERCGTGWRISEEMRSSIEFRQLNLIESWHGLGMMDVIFMRNVLIYFEVEVKKRVLASARKHLERDGYLFLGAAETTMNLDDAFERAVFDKASCFRLKS